MAFHQKSHSNDIHHQCKQCGAGYESLIRLEHHMKKEHRKNQNCPICRRKLSTVYKLINHVKNYHDIDHLLFCEYCATCFATETAKEAHTLSQHGTTEIVRNIDLQHYRCHHCWLSFTSKETIEKHLLTKHFQNTGKSKMVYDCYESSCDKKFSKHQYLQGHMIVHSGKKHFQCDYCALAFTRKPKLQKHLADREQSGKCTF
jgi:KRAB domain-containing zinc finger protein